MALGKAAKFAFGAVIVGGSLGVAAANSAALTGLYHEVFPTDPARQRALELCILQDRGFNRLDPAQREACYRHALLPATAADADRPEQQGSGVNFVDLSREAGEGRLPADDIRLRNRTETPPAR